MGIRLSLGANPGNIVLMVLGQSLRIAAVGIVAGVLAAAGLSRYLQSLLYGTSPLDHLTFAVVVAFILAVSFVASYLPARRAARVDPATTLRYE